MFKNRRTSLIAIAVFIIAVIASIMWFLYPDGKPKQVEKRQKSKQKKNKELVSQVKDEAGQEKVSIKDLDHFYSSDVGRIAKWECDHKRALLEFVFVKRDDNRYSPVGISAIRTKKVSEKKLKDSECPYRNIASSGKSPYIYYLNIARHCKNCTVFNALIPGEKYKFKQIGQHEELNYTFQVPPAEKLEFRHEFDRDEIKGTKDDPVHRIPVVVEEAVKTKKEPEKTTAPTKPATEKTLRVKGVPDLADSEQLIMYYMLKGSTQLKPERVGEDTWEITFRQRGQKSKTGGLLALYRAATETRSSTGNFLQLVGYVPEVTENPVHLSGSRYKDFHHKSWHREQVRLTRYLSDTRLEKWRNLNPQKVTGEKAVVLNVRGTNTEEPVYVSASTLKVKDNDVYVTLTAPAGVYELMVEDTVVRSSFRWPPDEE